MDEMLDKSTKDEKVKGRPQLNDWDTGHCPFFVFADEDSAEYDMKKVKNFFSRFKKK